MPRRLPPGVLITLLLIAPAHAQPSVEPPVRGRPPQFSQVVGTYSVQASAAPAEVPVEQPITLRVLIAGKGPEKYQPQRARLHLFPDDWEQDFYIEPAPDEDHALPAEGAWEFVYRLRPKHQRVTAIDGIKLV